MKIVKASVRTRHRKKVMAMLMCVLVTMVLLCGQLVNVCLFKSSYYLAKAEELHERERSIKAARGRILDTNGVVLADNKAVCTISVIHSQIEDKEKVINVLSDELGISYDDVKKRVEKVSSIERVKTNVDKDIGDKIRSYELPGVKVDEDYKRYYPHQLLHQEAHSFVFYLLYLYQHLS